MPIIRPDSSGRVLVLAQDFAEAVVSSDVEVDDPGLFGDRFGCGAQTSGGVRVSSRGGGVLCVRGREGGVLLVGGSGAQAVVQAAEGPDRCRRP